MDPTWLYIILVIAIPVLQHVANKLKLRLPDAIHPEPVKPDGTTVRPSLPPVPDGKGSLILWLLDVLGRLKTAPDTVTPQERAELRATWHILPDEEPK